MGITEFFSSSVAVRNCLLFIGIVSLMAVVTYSLIKEGLTVDQLKTSMIALFMYWAGHKQFASKIVENIFGGAKNG